MAITSDLLIKGEKCELCDSSLEDGVYYLDDRDLEVCEHCYEMAKEDGYER